MILVSYSRRNEEQRDKIIARIRRLKPDAKIWFDKERIDVGTDWWSEIDKAITACSVFIAVQSQAYIQSEICKKELELAHERKKKIVQLLIEEVKLPDPWTKFDYLASPSVPVWDDADAISKLSRVLDQFYKAPPGAQNVSERLAFLEQEHKRVRADIEHWQFALANAPKNKKNEIRENLRKLFEKRDNLLAEIRGIRYV